MCSQVLVLSTDLKQNRVMLSTRHLESSPGEMLTNPQKVMEGAEATAERYRARLVAAQAAAMGEAILPGP